MPDWAQDAAAALGMAGAEVEAEPLNAGPAAPQRLTIRASGQPPRTVLLRPLTGEASQNHAAVIEALANRGFAHAARPLAFIPGALVEEWVDGLTALAVVPPPGSFEAAMDALAALHSLDVKEGLRWEYGTETLLSGEEFPLHRLGFASHERELALPHLADTREALLEGAFGFVHGNASAGHLLFAGDRVVFTGFGQAGFGSKAIDVGAFLATCGASAAERRELAGRYARARGLDVAPTVDRIDVATVWWGLHEQLLLPRRLIEALGDEAATEQLRLGSSRVERALREPAGDAKSVAALRATLWPS